MAPHIIAGGIAAIVHANFHVPCKFSHGSLWICIMPFYMHTLTYWHCQYNLSIRHKTVNSVEERYIVIPTVVAILLAVMPHNPQFTLGNMAVLPATETTVLSSLTAHTKAFFSH